MESIDQLKQKVQREVPILIYNQPENVSTNTEPQLPMPVIAEEENAINTIASFQANV